MVIGIGGALGRTNLTSSNRCLRLFICSTASAQPAPLSPSPWMKMTVAVCLPVAGSTMGAARRTVEAMFRCGVGGEEEDEAYMKLRTPRIRLNIRIEIQVLSSRSCIDRRLSNIVGRVGSE